MVLEELRAGEVRTRIDGHEAPRAIALPQLEVKALERVRIRRADGMRARVLDKQRADRAASRVGRVRPSIMAMVREAMERRFADLLATHPTAVFAHRDLEDMSDDDLRTALEDAETLIERMT